MKKKKQSMNVSHTYKYISSGRMLGGKEVDTKERQNLGLSPTLSFVQPSPRLPHSGRHWSGLSSPAPGWRWAWPSSPPRWSSPPSAGQPGMETRTLSGATVSQTIYINFFFMIVSSVQCIILIVSTVQSIIFRLYPQYLNCILCTMNKTYDF